MAEQPSEKAGWPLPKHGAFCWTEIASNDADSSGMDYREFSTGDPNPVGGLYEINPDFFGGNPPPPHFMTYVAVDDVDENAKRAVELGGTIVKPPMDIPNVGRMCIIQDPTGAMIATFRMKN